MARTTTTKSQSCVPIEPLPDLPGQDLLELDCDSLGKADTDDNYTSRTLSMLKSMASVFQDGLDKRISLERSKEAERRSRELEIFALKQNLLATTKYLKRSRESESKSLESLADERRISSKLVGEIDVLSKSLTEERLSRSVVEEELSDALYEKWLEKRVMEKKIANLKSSLEAKQKIEEEKYSRNLKVEKRKMECQICFSSPKDTIVFPCLHLCCCSRCLVKHNKLSKTCPKCRGPLNGALRCDLSVD